jgi:hypothetical protein
MALSSVSSFRKPYTCRRRALGVYTKGEWVPGAWSTFTILASVQAAPAGGMQSLPEGRRHYHEFKVYSDTELFQALQGTRQDADQIFIEDDWYEVTDVNHWNNNVLPHHEITVKRIDA